MFCVQNINPRIFSTPSFDSFTIAKAIRIQITPTPNTILGNLTFFLNLPSPSPSELLGKARSKRPCFQWPTEALACVRSAPLLPHTHCSSPKSYLLREGAEGRWPRALHLGEGESGLGREGNLPWPPVGWVSVPPGWR